MFKHSSEFFFLVIVRILVTSNKVMCITCYASDVNNLQKNHEVACRMIGQLGCLSFTIRFQKIQLESET